ncbi:MAG: hypothetical protein IPL45_11855 [Actinomycetales bacterium]|nr:hypothetical protein [Actinomycetales bacterium]
MRHLVALEAEWKATDITGIITAPIAEAPDQQHSHQPPLVRRGVGQGEGDGRRSENHESRESDEPGAERSR